ncbi:MAG: hypothetical protein WDM91_10375 [Rhizomicrobium sp.]
MGWPSMVARMIGLKRHMKQICAAATFLLLLGATPALAQVYPGEEVTVNPGAIGGSGYLLYPGGKYGRHVPHLLQPGERAGGVIHLHLPVKHRRVARRVKAPAAIAATTAPATPDTLEMSPDMTPATPTAPPPRRVAATAPPKPARRAAPPAPEPAATPAPTAGPEALPEDSAARLFSPNDPTVTAPKPAPIRRASAPPPAPTPRRIASAAPAPANTSPPAGVQAGLRRQSVIPFAAGASSPAMADVNAIHALATTLNQALAGGASKVQLEAYAGPRGDKSPDSRRLSIKRALVIRELLIEDGVPSEKIDVRAMAGADDGGPADRVDVFVRA